MKIFGVLVLGVGLFVGSSQLSVGQQGNLSVNDLTANDVTVNGTLTGGLRFQSLGSEPTNGVTGDVYYNTSEGKLHMYAGTNWYEVGTTVTAVTNIPPYSIPTEGLLVHYAMTNSAQTSVIVDLTGSDNHGTNFGAGSITFVPQSATITAHMSLPIDAGWDIDSIGSTAKTFTVVGWIKGGDESGYQFYLNDNGGTAGVIAREQVTAPVGAGYFDGAWKSYGYGVAETSDDTWHNYVWILDQEDSTTRMYVDGVVVGVTNSSWTPDSYSGHIGLGIERTGNPSYGLRGETDSLLKYDNQIWTVAQITNFFHNTRAPSTDLGMMGHGWTEFGQTDPNRGSLQVEYNFEYDAAADTSGNNNHGTLSGPTHAVANTNGYYSFDGTNDTIVSGSAIEITGTDARTFAMWVNRTDTSTVDNILACGADSSLDSFNLLYLSGSGHMRVSIGGAHLQWDDAGSLGWDHVVYTYPFAGQLGATKLYINGVDQGPPDSSSGPTSFLTTSNSVLTVGEDVGAANPFLGFLDDIRVYSTELSSNDVLTLYTDTLSVHP